VKLKWQWRLQDVRDTRNMERVLREAVGNMQNQSERMTTWAAARKAI
jgi:hypothetical protein